MGSDDGSNIIKGIFEMAEVYSLNGEIFQAGSVEEMLEYRDGDVNVGDSYYIGDAVPVETKVLFDADDLESYVVERMYDEVGEAADGWMYGQVDKKALNVELHALIDKYFPNNFYRVVNVRECKLTKEDIE